MYGTKGRCWTEGENRLSDRRGEAQCSPHCLVCQYNTERNHTWELTTLLSVTMLSTEQRRGGNKESWLRKSVGRASACLATCALLIMVVRSFPPCDFYHSMHLPNPTSRTFVFASSTSGFTKIPCRLTFQHWIYYLVQISLFGG